MGCDIHMNVEVRRDGRWQFVEPPVRNYSWDPNGTYREWWSDRSYIVFSVLAGVCRDDGDPPPIDEPRGYPKDADPVTVVDPPYGEDHPDDRGQNHGDHSHSWLTLDEILAYGWDKRYWKSGVVSLREWLRGKRDKTTPESWSRWIGGKNVRILTATEASRWIKTTRGKMEVLRGLVGEDKDVFSGDIYVDMKWRVKLSDRCAGFLRWVNELPDLLQAKPEDIRLVFSFDS